MVTSRRLRDAHVATCADYHAINACVIRRVTMTAVTAATQALLRWLRVHIVVVGWMFGGVGCHATSKGAELSCELDYAISFWSWILS